MPDFKNMMQRSWNSSSVPILSNLASPFWEERRIFFWISSCLVFLTTCLKPTLHDRATRWQNHIMPRMVSHQPRPPDPRTKKVQPQKCNPSNTEHKTTCLKWTQKHVALQQPSQKEEEIINQREIHLKEYDCSYIWILQHVFFPHNHQLQFQALFY